MNNINRLPVPAKHVKILAGSMVASALILYATAEFQWHLAFNRITTLQNPNSTTVSETHAGWFDDRIPLFFGTSKIITSTTTTTNQDCKSGFRTLAKNTVSGLIFDGVKLQVREADLGGFSNCSNPPQE